MKWLKYVSIVSIAIVLNLAIFLLVPLLQVLFSHPDYSKAKKNNIEREMETVVQKQIEKIEKKEIKPIKSFTKKFTPSAPVSRNVQMDLSVSAGGQGVAVQSGNIGVMTYLPGETDTDAKIIGNPGDPKMPLRAEREGVEGYVNAVWVVNESGRVIEISIVTEEPLGYGFGNSVRDYLKKIKWQPAAIKQVPVRQKITQTFRFSFE